MYKKKIEKTLYKLSAREYIINKSNKLVYCVKEELKFLKGTSGEVTLTRFLQTLHVYSTAKQRDNDFFMWSSCCFNTEHAVYF